MMLKHCFLSFLIIFLWTYGEGNQPTRASLRPQRAEFQSFNLQTILHWQPGNASIPNNTLYFVQYKIYGQKVWTNKKECWGIQEVLCDMTNETSDVQEPYYGRVKAASAGIHTDWSMTRRYIPWLETKIGRPSVNMIQSDRSMKLILHAPNSPYKKTNRVNISMKSYYDLVYRVFITNNSLDKIQKTTLSGMACKLMESGISEGCSDLKMVDTKAW